MLWEYRTVAAGWGSAFAELPLNQSLHGLISRFLAPALDVPALGASAAVSGAAEVLLPLAACVLAVYLLRRGEPASVVQGTLQFYAVGTLMLLASPFTENIHLTWIVPGASVLLVLLGQEARARLWYAIALGTYLWLALPFTENASWQAGTDVAGRLASSLECYGLAALCFLLCRFGFRRDLATSSGSKAPAQRRRWIPQPRWPL
jgi:hypothetical protein